MFIPFQLLLYSNECMQEVEIRAIKCYIVLIQDLCLLVRDSIDFTWKLCANIPQRVCNLPEKCVERRHMNEQFKY